MGIPSMGPSSETISFCVCPKCNVCLHNDIVEWIPSAGFCISLSRAQLMTPDPAVGRGVKRQLSVYDTVCLFDRKLVSSILFHTLARVFFF